MIDYTVRWISQYGGEGGWFYRRSLGKSPVWGFDNLGQYDWLRTAQHGSSGFFVAPDGRHFDTMRELFATFRLRLCDCDRETDQLEVLRHALRLVALRDPCDGFHRLCHARLWR
jgi:hypothetical protein